MNTRKITLLMVFFMSILFVNAVNSQCEDLNGYVNSKNTGGTGYITLFNGFEESAAQTYHYSAPGQINQVRVYGNYPGLVGGVPLQVNIYNVDANGRPTSTLKSVNFAWYAANNSANPANSFIDVSLGTGVFVNANFAVGVSIRQGVFPFGFTFQVRYTGNGESLGENLASLAGTSTGGNWASAATAFSKDGDFYLVPRMVHFNTPSFTVSSSCIATQGTVTFTSNSTLTQDRMFNLISKAGYTGTNKIYTWDFGDGSGSNVANPTHTYTTAGKKTVTLTTTIEGWNTTCTETFSAEVSVGLAASTSQLTNVSCFGLNNGSINGGASGGASPYKYSLDGLNYVTSNSFNSLAPGNYTMYVKDDLGCIKTSSFVITQPAAITFSSTQTTSATCGSTNGQILVTAVGGNGGSYSYTLNGGTAQSTGSFNNLGSGSYQIVATAAGCSGSTTVIVNNQDGPTLSLPINKQNVSCFGGNDGAITLSAAGGTGTLQYSNNGGVSFQASPVFSGLTAGTYSTIVKDAAGCQNGSVVTIVQPSQLVFNAIPTAVSCNGGNNGSVTITSAIGGLGALSYSINNGITYQSGTTFSGLAVGTYTILLRDIAGCTVSKTITVSQPSPLSATASVVNPSCNGGTNGSINVSGSGGNPGYSYSTDGVNFTKYGTYGDLGVGIYTFYVKDRNNCVCLTNVTLTQPNAITGNILTTNSTCGNSNGALLVQPAGGSGSNYQFSIDGGDSFTGNALFGGLSSGQYFIIIKDGTGCEQTVSGNVFDSDGPTIQNVTSTNISCNGASDGSINVTLVTGGTGTLEYSVNGTAWQTSPVLAGLTAGTYLVKVRDANGCLSSQSVTLTQPAPFVISSTNTNLACNGGNSGIIDVTAIGGAGTLAYSINNGASYQSSKVFNNLFSGNYLIIVRDAAGCTGAYFTTLTEPTPINILTSVLDVTCHQEGNGQINVAASGGVGTKTYSIDGTNYQPGNSFSGLDGGTYTIYAKDANGCVSSKSVTVIEPLELTVAANVTDVSCAGGSNGVIDLSVTGGVSPYTYEWSNFATTEDIFNLTAGSYSGIITDANGCSASGTFTISQPSLPLIVNGVITSSSEGDNGAIDITVTGGFAPYAYDWSNGAISQDISGLAPGNYSIEVSDIKGCVTTNSFIVDGTTGLTSINGVEVNVLVYPNPANQYAVIEAIGTTINKVRVTNVVGQNVMESQFNSSKIELNTSELQQGIYHITLITTNGITNKQLQVIK